MKIPQHPLRGFISVYRKSLEKGLPSLERTHKVGGSGGRGKGHKKVVKSKLVFFPRAGALEQSYLPAWRYAAREVPGLYLPWYDREIQEGFGKNQF